MAVVPQSLSPLSASDLETIIAQVLEEARARGASQAEAAVSQNSGLSIGVRLGQVETLEHQRDRSLGVTVYFGQRKASASTADFSTAAVHATVAKACSIARFTAEDACAGLADPNLMQTRNLDLDLSHPWDIDAPAAIELARECEAAALRRWILASTTRKAPRCPRTADCMCTAIRTASSAGIPPRRIR